ncbi:MAG: hypothetical protein K2X93_03875 [Candidatus Obscuribacterales bacterium]|nr:hypothetical protein [Candidatus Obscuribacterales bacterium]
MDINQAGSGQLAIGRSSYAIIFSITFPSLNTGASIIHQLYRKIKYRYNPCIGAPWHTRDFLPGFNLGSTDDRSSQNVAKALEQSDMTT